MYYVLTKERKLLDDLFSKKVFRKRSSEHSITDEDEYWWDNYTTSRLCDDKTDFYIYTNYKPSSTQTTTLPTNSTTIQTEILTHEATTQTDPKEDNTDHHSYFLLLIKNLLTSRY